MAQEWHTLRGGLPELIFVRPPEVRTVLLPHTSSARPNTDCGDCFDFETHLCTVYEQRPQVCSGYPYYGGDALPREVHDGCAHARAAPPLV